MKYFLLITLMFALPASAADNDIKKIPVAVFGISSHNCPPSTGKAVADIFSGHIFRSKIFIMLDKNQVERIAAREGLVTGENYDLPVLLKIGTKLSVQKIISGSVNKIGSTYTLEIRSIDVAKASVDILVSEKTESESDLDAAIKKCAYRIERYYLGYDSVSGKYDLVVTPSAVMPLGRLAKGFIFAPGVSILGSLNDPFKKGFDLQLSVSYYRTLGNRDGVAFIHFIPVEFFGAKRFSPQKNINLIPAFGIGVLPTYMSADPLRNKISSNYVYRKNWYANLLLTAKLEADIFLFNRYYLFVTPSYRLVYESSGSGHLVGVDLGLKYIF